MERATTFPIAPAEAVIWFLSESNISKGPEYNKLKRLFCIFIYIAKIVSIFLFSAVKGSIMFYNDEIMTILVYRVENGFKQSG